MGVKNGIKNILADVLKVGLDELREDGVLYDDIGVDSTEVVEIITALEKNFRVKLDAKEITKYSSINDIENVINSKLG